MNAIWKIFAASILAMSPVAMSDVPAKDTVVSVPNEDAEMNAAIAKARKSLPEFWARAAKPAAGDEQFALKVAISDGVNREHFWLGEITREKGVLSGEIDNDPVHVHTVKRGQRYVIPEKDISDWMYLREGKIVGGYTLRAMLRYMPADQAAALRARLAPE